MSEPNERDKALGLLLDVYQDVDLRTIAAYREECVKAERERVLVEVEARLVERDDQCVIDLADALEVIAKLRGETK